MKVTAAMVAKRFNLTVISGEKGLDREIGIADLSRPGLEFAGYFSYYDAHRIQILGTTEMSFYELLSLKEKEARMNMLCTRKTPCIIISRGMEAPPELIESSNMYDTPVFSTTMSTTKFMGELSRYLSDCLAEETSIHGVLLDVYGVGLLITGESGVGKSEVALELVKRGHRLVGDDRIDVKELEPGLLKGTAPELIKHLLEIRGLGIINVMTLFGTGAVRDDKIIDLNVHLEHWQDGKMYDRIGLNSEKLEILNSAIDKKTIPVRPGRNLAIIIEVAAMNYRLNIMGINTAEEFTNRLQEQIIQGGE